MGQDIEIKRLQVQTKNGNDAALKLGLQHCLRQMRGRPAHLPPRAILIIRRLDALPPFRLQAAAAGHWRQQVQARLDDLARRAVRPGRQYIPPDANSILFVDEVEMLVCYTRDMLARRFRWYWAELFPTIIQPAQTAGEQLPLTPQPAQTAGEQLVVGWGTYPEAIPHLLVHLNPAEVRAAMTCLNRRHLSQLAHSLHQTFVLPGEALQATVADIEPAGEAGTTAQDSAASTTPVSARAASSADGGVRHAPKTIPPAPWTDRLPPALRGALPPPAEYLVGLCYTLVKQPQQARQKQFARQAARWLEQTTVSRQARPNPAVKQPPAETPGRRPDGEYFPAASPRPGPPNNAASPPPDVVDQIKASEPAISEGLSTRLGGVFYLINCLTRLRLPAALADLATLNPWELLGAIAADLLGDRIVHYQADPLWGVLSELAGLEADALWGAALPAPGEFALRPEWLAGLTGDSCQTSWRASNRLQLWAVDHDFLVADLANQPGAMERIRASFEEAGLSLNPKPGDAPSLPAFTKVDFWARSWQKKIGGQATGVRPPQPPTGESRGQSSDFTRPRAPMSADFSRLRRRVPPGGGLGRPTTLAKRPGRRRQNQFSDGSQTLFACPLPRQTLFALARKQSFRGKGVPKQSLGTRGNQVRQKPTPISPTGGSVGRYNDRETDLHPRVAPNLAWWVVRLGPFLRFWLKRACGNPERRLETMLAKPATLHRTPTHIDVYMPLDAIDLDLRRAGLDRNPGWVPDFGHIITFHFE